MYPPSAFSLGDLCLPPMANVLKVFLENGQTKSFKYDATTTVADVITSLKDKLCISAEDHFSLVVEHVKSMRRNKLTLLDPKESLARIAARPGSHKMRCLYRIVFMPTSAAELAQQDLAALEYLYLQCCNDVAQDRFVPELQPEVALRLAALHIHQHAREFGLERFVPCSLLESMKRKELRRLAKLHYLDIVGGLPSYGAKCFSSTRPERVLLVSPRFALSQIVGRKNIFVYYKVATGKELNVEIERELLTEDIAPPYLSQHHVVPAKWSYINYDDQALREKKHFAIFTMPPPYLSTPEQTKPLDNNMNSNIANRNSSNNSSPLLGHSRSELDDIQFEKCKRSEFRLFDPNDPCFLDDGMGFDLQSVLSMELLESATNPKLVEAKNEEVLRRVAEMQKLVENSEQYLTENCDVYNENVYNGILRDELVGRETCVDNIESDTESNTSRMSEADAPGVLKHSDSLLLLTETISQGLSALTVAENKDKCSDLTVRQSQGLSAILNNCGLTDALLALNSDMVYSESDNDSSYTPTSSPVRKHLNKPPNKAVRTSFGLVSPDLSGDCKEPNLKEYLKQLREKSNREDNASEFYCQDSVVDTDAELIDLTLIPPPQTPDELDSAYQVPQILPVVPPSFADDSDKDCVDGISEKGTELDEFIANVTVHPPTVKITPAIELTPEEIMSYIIPPPPISNTSTLDKEQPTYSNQSQLTDDSLKKQKNTNEAKYANGDVVKGALSVSEIRNMFTAKTLSDARNSLLLKDKAKGQSKSDSPKSKRKSLNCEKQANGNAHIIEYPTVERKGMFSCCSKDKNKNEDSDEMEQIESCLPNSDSMPDVCEVRPPPRRKSNEIKQPPERPPKTPPTPAPRPRSNSFTCTNNELNVVEIPNNYNTLNSRKFSYKLVCDMNEGHIPPEIPPRLENVALSPPPPILLPPKKPPLPPVPSIEVLRLKTSQKTFPVRNSERLASIGSPHFQRNLNSYRNLELESRLTDDESRSVRSTQNYSSLTLQNRHVRSNSETKNTILKNREMSTALSLCSPQMNRRFSNRPDILNGAPVSDQRVFSPPLNERKIRKETPSPTPKVQNHVRFKEDVVDDIPTPPSPPSVKFLELQPGNNGRVSIENLLRKTEVAVDGLLQRLHQVAQKCSHQHAHGGGEDIDEVKFQALGRHTSAPLQTRNLVLRVHDVTGAFKELAGADMARIIHDHNTKSLSPNSETNSTLEGQLALRAECLANVDLDKL
ncbi:unnamed protein product [Leptidea sinapis]|uniref:FERM domain-containing protein n=1 Tax=Leptidea sinapis TaxID=189913 RepID=A0A5E4PT03_9NEOP|nr:unnamed protein product [Leptidea sinapis]